MTVGYNTISGKHRGYSFLIERHQEEDCSKWVAEIRGPDGKRYREPEKLTYSLTPASLIIDYIDAMTGGNKINGST